MSAAIASRAEQCVIDACWRQWRTLVGDGLVAGQRPARSIIDPEALVLASLALRDHERRLADRLLWWASGGAGLMSVQRLVTLKDLFRCDAVEEGVRWFATRAMSAGDARWRGLAEGRAHTVEPSRAGKGPAVPQLLEPSTLMLRLRAGFGVGAKADVMTFLIGACGAQGTNEMWVDAVTIARATSYAPGSVRRAVREMALARFVDASAAHPRTYSVHARRWARALGLHDPFARRPSTDDDAGLDVPPWRFWSHHYGLLVAAGTWARSLEQEEIPAVVAASRARDLVERFPRALTWTGVPAPDPRLHPGERYGAAFATLVEELARFVDEDGRVNRS